MKLIVSENPQNWAEQIAMLLRAEMERQTNPVFILPTGGTPEPVYAALVRMHRAQGLSFKGLTTFNLDEYVGLPADHSQSYRCYMQQKLFSHVDIIPANTHVPVGVGVDLDEQCKQYEQAYRTGGGADLALLGVGGNGHIGFNEPGTDFDSVTHVVRLSERTRSDNARFFVSIDEVPRQALTMGLGSIFSARKIVLIATGAEKADIVYRAFHGPVTTDLPASILQRHPDVTVVLDKAAARRFLQESLPNAVRMEA